MGARWLLRAAPSISQIGLAFPGPHVRPTCSRIACFSPFIRPSCPLTRGLLSFIIFNGIFLVLPTLSPLFESEEACKRQRCLSIWEPTRNARDSGVLRVSSGWRLSAKYSLSNSYPARSTMCPTMPICAALRMPMKSQALLQSYDVRDQNFCPLYAFPEVVVREFRFPSVNS